jgi:hypothetical protein
VPAPYVLVGFALGFLFVLGINLLEAGLA